jgi:hypothetical protein
LVFQPSRAEVDEAAAAASEVDLAKRFIRTLNQLAHGLDDLPDTDVTRSEVRHLIARLGDDLRMLRESWHGRVPTPPPPEGRPLQSRPDASLSVLQRQAEAIAEGTRMLVDESRSRGKATIPDETLGSLSQAQHLAAMTMRVEAARRQLTG